MYWVKTDPLAPVMATVRFTPHAVKNRTYILQPPLELKLLSSWKTGAYSKIRSINSRNKRSSFHACIACACTRR